MVPLENNYVIWITGVSGVGKTTIALALQKKLQSQKCNPVLLDGDAMREAMQDPHYGYDRESRLRGGSRYSRFAKMISEQGVPVIVSTISLFHELHQWNRENLQNYFEVWVRADEQTLRERDPKKLYQKQEEGNNSNMTGIDVVAEFPVNPHLILENGANADSVDDQVEKLLQQFGTWQWLGARKA